MRIKIQIFLNFSFPYNEELLNEWLRVISNVRVTKYSRICSKHFRELDYEIIGDKRKLKRNAIPSLFLNDSENVSNLIIKEAENMYV